MTQSDIRYGLNMTDEETDGWFMISLQRIKRKQGIIWKIKIQNYIGIVNIMSEYQKTNEH